MVKIDLIKYYKSILMSFFLILIFVLTSNLVSAQYSFLNLKTGLYKSKCYPTEKIFIDGEAGRNWSVGYITWQRGVLNKQYILLYNQTMPPSGCYEEIVEDAKHFNVLRLKTSSNKILLTIIRENNFKTSDGCEWVFFSEGYPSINKP